MLIINVVFKSSQGNPAKAFLRVKIMLEFTFDSHSSISTFVSKLGAQTLISVYGSSMISSDDKQTIREAIIRANQTVFNMVSFNDGNTNFEEDLHIDLTDVNNPVLRLIRSGFGSGIEDYLNGANCSDDMQSKIADIIAQTLAISNLKDINLNGKI